VHELWTLGGVFVGRQDNIRIFYVMNKKYLIGNSILWAAAIVASAVIHAPFILSGIILPALAFTSVIVICPKSKDSDCKKMERPSV
jgi:hypothetical protein